MNYHLIQQPQSIGLQEIIQIISTFLTAIAVVVALFQEKIKQQLSRTIILPRIDLSPPDCHQIDLRNSQTGEYAGKAIYIRIRAIHKSGPTGNNVEIIISKVEKKNESGKWEIYRQFLPMNLAWSHTHEQVVTIAPESFRHCDLGSFRQNLITNSFLIDTIVQPNPVSEGIIPNLLKPGKYKLQTVLTGTNVKPVITNWYLAFDATWDKEESVMFKHIKIRKLSEN